MKLKKKTRKLERRPKRRKKGRKEVEDLPAYKEERKLNGRETAGKG